MMLHIQTHVCICLRVHVCLIRHQLGVCSTAGALYATFSLSQHLLCAEQYIIQTCYLQGSSNNPYAEHGWNLNNLPKLDGTYGSMLRHIEENIPGVVVPWMYIGMMFSSFCWHIEDHMFYSINYHHWGGAKKWYGVPGSAGHLFEEAFRKALPGHFERQPDLLFHLTTLLSPRILHQYGVPVYSTTQQEGEFVITFPNAYHGGFNMGFNCAEAVNFAPADWFRFGSAGTERFRTFRKPSVVSHERLLLKVLAGVALHE